MEAAGKAMNIGDTASYEGRANTSVQDRSSPVTAAQCPLTHPSSLAQEPPRLPPTAGYPETLMTAKWHSRKGEIRSLVLSSWISGLKEVSGAALLSPLRDRAKGHPVIPPQTQPTHLSLAFRGALRLAMKISRDGKSIIPFIH